MSQAAAGGGEAPDQRTRPVQPVRGRGGGGADAGARSEESQVAVAREPLRPAGERTGSGAVPVLGVVLALLVLALGVVLVRDALVALGVVGGDAWLAQLVDLVAGTAPATWLVPVGVAVVLVGLYVLSVALGRRTRTEVRLRSRTAVTTEPRDLARLCSTLAREVDGVLSARTSAGRRSVVVRLSTTGDDGVARSVEEAVTDRLAVLERTPSVRVRAEAPGR